MQLSKRIFQFVQRDRYRLMSSSFRVLPFMDWNKSGFYRILQKLNSQIWHSVCNRSNSSRVTHEMRWPSILFLKNQCDKCNVSILVHALWVGWKITYKWLFDVILQTFVSSDGSFYKCILYDHGTFTIYDIFKSLIST